MLNWWSQRISVRQSGQWDYCIAERSFRWLPRDWILSQRSSVRQHHDWWRDQLAHHNCKFYASTSFQPSFYFSVLAIFVLVFSIIGYVPIMWIQLWKAKISWTWVGRKTSVLFKTHLVLCKTGILELLYCFGIPCRTFLLPSLSHLLACVFCVPSNQDMLSCHASGPC